MVKAAKQEKSLSEAIRGRRATPSFDGTPIPAEDLDGFEQELLAEWWSEASRTDEAVLAPDARTLARTPRSVRRTRG